MTINELCASLEERTQKMWLDKPADVERMVGRNYETGKEFSCWAYCWGYLSNLAGELYMVYGMAKEEQGDLATHKLICAERCRTFSANFQAAGHMEDTCQALADATEGFEQLTTFSELAQLSRTLQRYLMQMSFWVDIELPWAEVSDFVDTYWHKARA